MKSPKFSLYFIKKRALKIFCKESRQDFYSAKRLLEKCFFALNSLDKTENTIVNSYVYGHLGFGFKGTDLYKRYSSVSFCYYCIYCGINTFN